jgi:hypothetical protein
MHEATDEGVHGFLSFLSSLTGLILFLLILPSDKSLGSDLLIPRLGAGATWNYPDTIPFGATLIINELWRVNLIGGVRNGFSHFPRDQEVWGYSHGVPGT